jgi:hypothetical protein
MNFIVSTKMRQCIFSPAVFGDLFHGKGLYCLDVPYDAEIIE